MHTSDYDSVWHSCNCQQNWGCKNNDSHLEDCVRFEESVDLCANF